MDTLNRRNTETVEIKLKEMNNTIYEQTVLINNLHNTLSSISDRMNMLETMVLKLKANMTGTGASVI